MPNSLNRMTRELLINVGIGEIRAATLSQGKVEEFYIERTNKAKITGNIYKGRVLRIVPGINGIFVDIGLERSALLVLEDAPSVQEKDELIVQVLKEPLNQKGAVVTTHLHLASVSLVYKPYGKEHYISSKIKSAKERERLHTTIKKLHSNGGSFILRTSAKDKTEEQLLKEIDYLKQTWGLILERKNSKTHMLYEDLNLPLSILRDRAYVDNIKVDCKKVYQELLAYADRFLPELKNNISHYQSEEALFNLYGVETLLEKALERRVELKSGAYLIIDTTEAMTTVDVNTGSFTEYKNAEFGLLQVNLEAAKIIAEQIRLRNLSGIIIIDFINMRDKRHQEKVIESLKEAFMQDDVKTVVGGLTHFGLVEVSRQRRGISLSQQISEPCPLCHQHGMVKSAQTISQEIYREIIKCSKRYAVEGYVIQASQAIMDYLHQEGMGSLKSLIELVGKPIRLEQIPHNQEHYKVILINEVNE